MHRLLGSTRYAMSVLIAVMFVGCAQPERDAETKIGASSSAVVPADFDQLTGAPWKGELTYLDYDRKVPVTIKSTLSVARMAGGPDGASLWDLRMGYTDEPHADGSEIAALSANGRDFRGEQVVERAMLADGSVRIVTEQDGEDDLTNARFRFVYLLAERRCSIQKLVRLKSADAFFERYIYRWSR